MGSGASVIAYLADMEVMEASSDSTLERQLTVSTATDGEEIGRPFPASVVEHMKLTRNVHCLDLATSQEQLTRLGQWW